MTQPPKWLSDHYAAAVTTSTLEPADSSKAWKCPNWKNSIFDKYNSIIKNDVWYLTKFPPGRSAISTRWVFTAKIDPEGNFQRFKSRLVVRGFKQQKGVDVEETFAPLSHGKWSDPSQNRSTAAYAISRFSVCNTQTDLLPLWQFWQYCCGC